MGARPATGGEGLLSRDEFKAAVFERSGGRCVLCGGPAVDAHHILDRKLFHDGGYYLSNGAAVCEDDHWRCETTELSVEHVRKAAGILDWTLPAGMPRDKTYDKWGNIVLEQGMLLAGPLAEDDGCRRALNRGGKLWRLQREDTTAAP